MKRWSYKQITEHTERMIKYYMEESRKAPSEPDRGNFVKWMWRGWAHGVFSSWERLTSGWQNEFDEDRLRALASDDSEIDVLIVDGHVRTKPKLDCVKCRGIGSYLDRGSLEYKNCDCCT